MSEEVLLATRPIPDRLDRFKAAMLLDAKTGDYDALGRNIDSLLAHIVQIEREKTEAEQETERLRTLVERAEAKAAGHLTQSPHSESASPLAQSTGHFTCIVEGCDKRAYGLNLYCPTHRRRAQRHGDPTIVGRRGRKKRGKQ